MSVLSNRNTWILGFLTWLIPFLAAIPFFDQDGNVTTDIFVFKAVMIVLLSLISPIFMARVMRDVDISFLSAGLTLGLIWFAINFGLDLIVLVGVFGNDLATWLLQTGIVYVNFIPLGYAMGWLLANHRPLQ